MTDQDNFNLYIMELLKDLQNPLKYKDVHEKIEREPLTRTIIALVAIIKNSMENPEGVIDNDKRIIGQTAAITLKNTLLSNQYKVVFTDSREFMMELLQELIQIIKSSNDELIVPHITLSVVHTLKGLKAEVDIILSTINEVFTKTLKEHDENTKSTVGFIDNLKQVTLGFESTYEILKEFVHKFEAPSTNKIDSEKPENTSDIEKISFIWENYFEQLSTKVYEIIKNNEDSDDSIHLRNIYVLMIRILGKVIIWIKRDNLIEIIKFIFQCKSNILDIILESAKFHSENVSEVNLKIINGLQRLEILTVDSIALEKHNLELFLEIAEYYYRQSFDQERLNSLKSVFLDEPKDKSIETECFGLAEIISQGVNFHKNILTSPSFWTDDILFDTDSTIDTVSVIEKRLNEYYTEDKLNSMIQTVIQFYLPLTTEDLELWEEDPITFYFNNKEMDYESVPLLRENSIAFVKAVLMKFSSNLQKLSETVLDIMKTKFEDSQSNDLSYIIEKEAYYHFLHLTIDDESSQNSQFIELINEEFSRLSPDEKIIKRRLIIILKRIINEFKYENKDLARQILTCVIKEMVDTKDVCLKLVCVYFCMDFYDDYYFQRDAYIDPVPQIFTWVLEFMNYLKELNHYEAIDECMRLLDILTRKYIEIAKEFIFEFLFQDDKLVRYNKMSVLKITFQILARIKDEEISSDIVQFWLNLIVDSVNWDDIFANEMALKLILVYWRRLQNYDLDSQPNPFIFDDSFLAWLEKIVSQLERTDEDEMVELFMILEEVHYWFDKLGVTQDKLTDLINYYEQIFQFWLERAEVNENQELYLLTWYYASNIAISDSGVNFIDLLVKVRDKIKDILTTQLWYEQETPSEFHNTLMSGYIVLSCWILLIQEDGGITIELLANEREQNFLKLFTATHEEYLRSIINESDEEVEWEPSTELHLAICYSMLYSVFCLIATKQTPDLQEVLSNEIFDGWKHLLKSAHERKMNALGDSPITYIPNILKESTNDAENSLLFDLHEKQKIKGKTKNQLSSRISQKEEDLLSKLIQ